MGSGASKEEEEVIEDTQYAQRSMAPMTSGGVESQANFTDGPKSKSMQGFHTRSRAMISKQGHVLSLNESRESRVDGYESHIIRISKDGFSSNDVVILEGQIVMFVWDDTCSPNMTLMQVVYDGERLRPVIGGYTAGPNECRGEYERIFNMEGEYKFVINKIRCTPFNVIVKRRTELQADVTDEGFNPQIICIDQGHSVRWSWRECNSPHTVNEVHYVMERGCFRRQQGKNQNLVATVTGTHVQNFSRPGLYYFKTESSELGKTHLCVVCVRVAPREFKIDILDRTFSPMILLIEEGDKVWWNWDRNKCKKLHHVYQIDAPSLDHKEDAPYEPTPDGFKWHNSPSKQGLMCYTFDTAGVYYYSDQNYDEAAEYIGTIIVKPKPKEHIIELKGKGFNPDVLYAQTGDRVWWTWDGDAVADVKESLLILEEDKVLNPSAKKQTPEDDENLLQNIDEDAMALMSRSGLATVNFSTIGVYTYKISDVGDNFDACSIIVNPGSKNHTVHLTDTGFEPKVITIRPNDRVWWVWQSGKKQHNIVQVSHQGVPIRDGFSSGLPRDSPSAFYHQFKSPGVFYFISKSLPKIFGAVVVATQPQVHEVSIDHEIKPDPVTLQLHDIICWVFKQSISHGTALVETVDQILDAQFSNVPITPRRCIARAVTQLGIAHYHSKSFQMSGKKKVTDETRLSSAVCDERCDYAIIKVNKRGFHPQEIYLQKGHSLMWTWKGSDEDHNIIHVTDPNSESPLSVIQGPKSFNSGKLLANNSFLYTFDEVGKYAVASQGAPGYSCVVNILDVVPRTSQPFITSDKKGGTTERYHRVDLATKTEGAEIYYTTDGSLPALHLDATKHYNPEKGVRLRESGLCFVRAIAVKLGQLHSHAFTSKRYWVLSEGDNEVSMDENSHSQEVEAKQTTSWDWWRCRPNIKGCFTAPGVIEIFWELPTDPKAQQQIKGYQVFLNGVSYCDMFPRSNNSLNISGLAGGRTYKTYVEVYPRDTNNVIQESNSLNLKCPIENDNGGPVISLVKTDKPDSLAIAWMSIDKPQQAIDGYLIYLNDQQCGPKLVPDPESNRCKVVIGSCELSIDYKIYVQALLSNSKETRMSNVLEVTLPLDVSRFCYPPMKERLEEEDLYMEYVEITEGSGYLKNMDDPDNPIWETETETGSSEEESEEEIDHSRTGVTSIGSRPVPAPGVTVSKGKTNQDVDDDLLNSDCQPLSTCKRSLRSFSNLLNYENDVAERQSHSNLPKAGPPRPTFYAIAKVIGRLSVFFNILRFGRGNSVPASTRWAQIQRTKPVTIENKAAHLVRKAFGEGRLTDGQESNGQPWTKQDSLDSSRGGRLQGNHRSGKLSGENMLMVPDPQDFNGLKKVRQQDSLDSGRGGNLAHGKRNDSLDSTRDGMMRLSRKRYDYSHEVSGARSGILSNRRGDSIESSRGNGGMYDKRGDSFDSSRGGSLMIDPRRRDSLDLHHRRAGGRGDYDGGRGSPMINVRRPGSSGQGSMVFQDEPDYGYEEGDGYLDDSEYAGAYAHQQYNHYYAPYERQARYNGQRFYEHDMSGDEYYDHPGRTPRHPQHRPEHKQVRFTDNLPKSAKIFREVVNSDSSFSDNDESVEHLYQSPQYMKSKSSSKTNNQAPHYQFGPAVEVQDSETARSRKKKEVYFDEFESDHSNYDNSREGSVDEDVAPLRRTVVKHKPPIPVPIPRVIASDYNGNHQYVLHEPYGNVPVYGSEPAPSVQQPLPPESGSMLERYLKYYGVEGDVTHEVPPGEIMVSESETETETDSDYTQTESSSEEVTPREPVQERQAPTSVNYFAPSPRSPKPKAAEKPVEQAKLETSESSESESEPDTGRAGRHVLILDATRKQATASTDQGTERLFQADSQFTDENVRVEQANIVGAAPMSSPHKTGKPRGHAIIEVQKTVALDKTGREVKASGDISEKTKLAVSTEKSNMIQVGEGELITGDTDGLLPAPSVMVESIGRSGVNVGWQLSRELDPQYKLLLYVVNVVGTKFSSEINSDISFECNLVEKGKQVRGVQHCWNINDRESCTIKGLQSGNTYRIYVIANYSMLQGNKPCEIQTTSAVLYYTTMGPPKAPTLRVVRVDSYQANLEWEEPALEKGLKLKGYQIYVDNKPLGGLRRGDVRQMVINNLIPGKTLSVYVVAVSDFADQESEPSRMVHITCPTRPPTPHISKQPSYKRGCVLMAWNKPMNHTYTANEEAISSYSIFIDGKWHGEVKTNKLSDKQGYQFFLTDLSPEQSYDVSVKAVSGLRIIDPQAQHIYCLAESTMSNIVPVMAPAAPKSPKLRLEGLHPDGIDVTWQVPQQCGEAFISGYQMLKNGKLYGSIIPPDVNSLRIRDVNLGDKIELQLIALTEHPVGKSDRRSTDGDKDSGIGGSSHPEDKITDVFVGERYAGCKPGPKLVVHYTGLVCAPTEVWCEKTTGHSALIVWKKLDETKAHFLRPDSYQVTWWPGDRPQEDIQSESTTDDHLLITGLRPSTSYTVVVEARKMEKYTDLDEGTNVSETPDGLNAFILSSKSEQLLMKTASPPDPPSNVGVTAMTCHSLKVGWDPPKEHGSDIIAIRVECVSLDPRNHHHVAVDTLPDSTLADVTGLCEKTDYLLKVIAVTEEYFDRLPDKHRQKRLRGFPTDVLASQEDSPWLPSSSILIKTSGTESPTNVRVIKATTSSLTLSWTPPLVHGSNKLTSQIVRWSDVKKSRRADHEDLQVASHVNLLPTEDTLTIEDLAPGAQYKIIIEAVVSVKTSLDPDKWDEGIEKFRRTAHVMSKPFYARTRAPIEPPKLLVTGYTQMSASLYWEKPPLMAVVGKDDEGNPKYLRRHLQGYKLEITGKLQCCLGPESNSCTLTKCKPGRAYNVVLVAMTCTDEGKKARKQKYKSYFKNMNTKEVDYMTLLQDDENLDESPSEPVEIILPKDQDGFLLTLDAKFVHQAERDNKTFGDIDVSWTVQGKTNLLKQFNIVWYSMDDRVIQTKYIGPEQRRCTIPVTRVKTVYHIKVEPGYYTDVLPQPAQEVQVMIPGHPDAPEIFLRSIDIDEFSIEWGEPRLYGGVKVKAYQVYLNEKKAGNELNANNNKATIPCRPNRTYRVNLVALSDTPHYGDSTKSNTLVVNSSGHGEASLVHQDDGVTEDSGIPIKVTKVTENGIHLDWSRFLEADDVASYKIQWSSVAQPEQREVRLSAKDTNCVINKCLPGTTHFVRIIACNVNEQILEKSRQMTVQTSAPPDAPTLSVRACNFRYIAVQWDKPTTYGDALVTGYKVYVNGIVEAILGADQLSYTYTQGKWCHEYAFQVQALTPDDLLNSKPSEPLVVTWPGSKAPAIKRLPSISSSTLRVGWDEPYLTDGLKVKHFRLCCIEEGTEKLVQELGPFHPDTREGEFKNLKKGNYSVYLEVHLYGTDSVIRSETIRMQPALSPDPPQITVTLVGWEERRQIEKFTCDLLNKRDRLIRQVGHKLKKIGALSHPLRAEKNEDVVFGAHALTRIEELLEDCFNALENYTGQLTGHVSWQCPQTNPDIQLSDYKVLVDGKQYGSPLHSGVRTVRIQLGLEQPNYRLTMVASSEKPQGTSVESNVVELLSMPFKPFAFYCYHAIHSKAIKYPAYGCCKYQDSITYERQVAKKLANQGLLHKQVPPPSCSLLDIFDGEYKPLMSNHSARCPTVILFWTPWCVSSQKIMDFYIRFARDNSKEMSYIAVTCGVSGTGADSRKSLAHSITSNSWREDKLMWHVTSECASNVYETMNSINRSNSGLKIEPESVREKYMDLTELLGIAGVPTFLFIHPDGHIAWHGRYCAFDYSAFGSFMRHTMSEIVRQPCPVFNCDCCKSDTSVDEDAMNLQLPNVISSQGRATTTTITRTGSPDSNDMGSRPDMKYVAINGYTDNVGGTERVFISKKARSRSPKSRKRRSHISVSKRPYSASGGLSQLDRSPYLACVAPHIHHPQHQTNSNKQRPASANRLMHYV